MKQEGPSFDLPLARWIPASELVETDQLDNFIAVGGFRGGQRTGTREAGATHLLQVLLIES